MDGEIDGEHSAKSMEKCEDGLIKDKNEINNSPQLHATVIIFS